MSYVEKPQNVHGDARLCGNAQVCGDALVYGDARVYGNARVCGNAQVHSGKWEKSPLQIQGTMHFLNHCGPKTIHIGCECHEITTWKQKAAKIGRKHGYTDEQIEEYLRYINLL